MKHWKSVVKPDCKYFGEQDFRSPSDTITVTIARHSEEEVQNEKGKSLKGVLYFRENIKPLILNVTNGKTIAKIYGKDADGWVGKRISLYYDPTVKVGKEVVGGTRVKAPVQSDAANPVCLDCEGPIEPASGMNPEQLAAYTSKKYGRSLCAKCATKAAAENQNKGEDAL
ncbi:MAG: hypothetical protein GXX92_08265 [Clostridiales bacterium]|nr:hypothetical protein [Clostridiales bacterium]